MTGIPIVLIAAVNQLGFIGNDGDLIVKCKRDLQRFKELSTNGVVIMGRKTYESLPKALPNRSLLVVSGAPETERKIPESSAVRVCGDLECALSDALKLAEEHGRDKIVIAGGEAIYDHFLTYATQVYLTRFDDTTFGDAKFPIRRLESMIGQGWLTPTGEAKFYEGDMQVVFEDYAPAGEIEAVLGDFIRLRTGHTFRLSQLCAVIPTEDSLMIGLDGCGFYLSKDQCHLGRLQMELEQLMEQEAAQQMEYRCEADTKIDPHFDLSINH